MELHQTYFDNKTKHEIIDLLNKWIKYTKELQYEANEKLNELIKGKSRDNESESQVKAKEEYIERRIAEIINQIEPVAKSLGLKSFDDFYKEPPEKRFIPSDDPGTFIRKVLYESLVDWDSIRQQVNNEEKQKIINRVNEAQSNKDPVAWEDLKDRLLIEKDADINTYDPKKVAYYVDHREDVAIRWNDKNGYNTDDSERIRQFSERDNLRLISASQNRGRKKFVYKNYVGPNFTSIKAEGGIKGALTICGASFTDAAKNPLKK